MQTDHVKDELRKRVFWCSYNLDRAVAITLGRPVGIADHDIDVEVRQSYGYFEERHGNSDWCHSSLQI